ncbi:protein PHOTOSYSTEM I ASSEMBLY 2, chloroplastic-like [Olea europaea var. sylvestris]|uniref:protein PHOTOSYSTEM I ASSEMBLY 2, chloroplastic-like n=1 Tax=Olea europaea var. sylvestris TaxID=158386 RepID=UPI000C1D7DE6|nr:protein PHOTOSYSTEM I ASSEMBLY 2, chloroplastic-like [Olea europaea var. sylvestris]
MGRGLDPVIEMSQLGLVFGEWAWVAERRRSKKEGRTGENGGGTGKEAEIHGEEEEGEEGKAIGISKSNIFNRQCLTCLCTTVALIVAPGVSNSGQNASALDGKERAVCQNCGGSGAIICRSRETSVSRVPGDWFAEQQGLLRRPDARQLLENMYNGRLLPNSLGKILSEVHSKRELAHQK